MLIGWILVNLVLAPPAGPLRADRPPADSLAFAEHRIELGDLLGAEAVLRRLIPRFEQRGARDSLAAAVDALLHVICWGERAHQPEAADLTRKALALRDTSAIADDPRAARALVGCAFQLLAADRRADAAVLGARVMDLLRRHPGPDSLHFAHGLYCGPEFRWPPGDPRSIEAIESVIRVRSRWAGPTHGSLATHWANLGTTQQRQGAFAQARSSFERALRITEGALSPLHPDLARAAHDLANVLLALGDYAEARTLYDRALRIRLAAHGDDHPEVARSLAALAGIHRRLGAFSAARDCAHRALAIREARFGAAHPDVATSLLQVGLIETQSGDFVEGAAYAARAAALRESLLGEGSAVTALAYDALAHALVGLGRGDSAATLARRALAAKSRELGTGHPDLARSYEMLAEASAAAGRLDAAIDAAIACERTSCEHLVRTLARLTEREALQYEAVRTTGLELAVRLAARPEATEAQRLRVWDAVVRSRGRAVEELGAKLRGRSVSDVGLDAVFARLPAGAALVSYVRCETTATPVRREAVYVAFVRGPAGKVVVRELGDAAALDSLTSAWWRALRNPATPAAHRRAGDRVRRRLWDPVVEACGGAERVFVVPDGRLTSLNLYTLPSRRGGYLVEEPRTLELLSAERRMARPPLEAGSGRLLALGGIDYGHSPSTLHAVARGGGSRWAPLARSGLEAREVAASWERSLRPLVRRATILGGRNATLANLETHVRGTEVLHLATHGVFGGEGVDPMEQLRTGRRERGTVPSVLVRSGVVLAPDPGASREPARTGFLSAADVTRLDLATTRWVVLSGCETGAGRRLPRADLLGLRAAFEMAGARVVIGSHGKVEDRWAHEWMRRLYRERYENRLPTGAAVRQASLGLLAERRRMGLPDDPRAWGAFVAVGRDD